MNEPLLNGTWIPVRAEMDGQPAPDLVVNRTELVILGARYTLRFAGEVAEAGELHTGAGTAPGGLDFRADQGLNAGRTLPAIHQIAGDRLRICFGLGGTRPDAYRAGPGTSRYLVTYRRLTPAP